MISKSGHGDESQTRGGSLESRGILFLYQNGKTTPDDETGHDGEEEISEGNDKSWHNNLGVDISVGSVSVENTDTCSE